jgi:prepilin-type N-terminal cleavage/methylation domain-containing protein
MRRVARRLRGEGGFTLPELLVTMMLMLTVMFALYSIFDMSLRVFSFGNDKTEAVEQARVGLERMDRELRAAYPYDRAGGNETIFQSYGPTQVTFGNDVDGDRRIIPGDTNEEITYSLNANGDRLLRNNRPMVEYVNGLSFEYLDASKAPATSEPSIAVVRITLNVRVQRGQQVGTQELTTEVALRNRTEQR